MGQGGPGPVAHCDQGRPHCAQWGQQKGGKVLLPSLTATSLLAGQDDVSQLVALDRVKI